MIHGNSRLSEEQIVTIRQLYAQGTNQDVLACQFQVNQPAISKIVRGVAHKHITRASALRYCVDCKLPLDGSKKRCEPCLQKWKLVYWQHWYKANRSKAAPRAKVN